MFSAWAVSCLVRVVHEVVAMVMMVAMEVGVTVILVVMGKGGVSSGSDTDCVMVKSKENIFGLGGFMLGQGGI